MAQSLGERELDIMAALWRDGPGTVGEVRERLPADLAYNTVLTILRNLEAKAFVGHEAERRQFRYHARVSEQAVRGTALSRIADKLFGGSSLGVVTHMVEQQALSDEELRGLQRLIDERLGAAPADKPKATPRPRRR
jgi:BlaI family transcriptional regulator, penicillinase repressor